jgi:hypothetical protein
MVRKGYVPVPKPARRPPPRRSRGRGETSTKVMHLDLEPRISKRFPARRYAPSGPRLGHLVDILYRRVPFFRAKMDARSKIKPQTFGAWRILPNLPFTTKKRTARRLPFQPVAVDLKEIVEIHASSAPPESQWWTRTPPGTLDTGPRPWARTLRWGATRTT